MGREKQDWKRAGAKAAVENQEAGGTEMIFSTRIVWPGQTDTEYDTVAAGSLCTAGSCAHWALMLCLNEFKTSPPPFCHSLKTESARQGEPVG